MLYFSSSRLIKPGPKANIQNTITIHFFLLTIRALYVLSFAICCTAVLCTVNCKTVKLWNDAVVSPELSDLLGEASYFLLVKGALCFKRR